MGGAQPLAVTMNGGVALVRRGRPARASQRRVEHALPRRAGRRPRRGARARASRAQGRAAARCRSGCVGNAAERAARAAAPRRRGRHRHRPDVARTTRCRYVPDGVDLRGLARATPSATPRSFTERARGVDGRARRGDGRLQDAGAEVFDYGNTIRARGRSWAASTRAFDFPGFVPAYIRPLFCEGKGPFRWAALSGDPADIARHRPARSSSCSPTTSRCAAGSRMAQRAGRVPGAAGAHLLARLRRARTGRAARSTSWSRAARCKAPIVIGRDHLDCGSVASPYRETEAMHDGSDAIADWPLLNALVNTASGATWVSIHHGGGVGIGRSLHAGQVSSPTAPTSPRRSSSACSPTTPAWASSATSTPATTRRSRSPTSAASASRCRAPDRPPAPVVRSTWGASHTSGGRPGVRRGADCSHVGVV